MFEIDLFKYNNKKLKKLPHNQNLRSSKNNENINRD